MRKWRCLVGRGLIRARGTLWRIRTERHGLEDGRMVEREPRRRRRRLFVLVEDVFDRRLVDAFAIRAAARERERLAGPVNDRVVAFQPV